MHSHIIQITTSPIDIDNYIQVGDFEQGDYSFYDYCCEISNDDRNDVITRLATNVLPSGMFTLVDANSLQYNGGIQEWRKEWATQIQARAAAITENNVMDWIGARYSLQYLLDNPLDTGNRFCTEDYPTTEAETSEGLMRMINDLQPGDKLYIGGIISFHY